MDVEGCFWLATSIIELSSAVKIAASDNYSKHHAIGEWLLPLLTSITAVVALWKSPSSANQVIYHSTPTTKEETNGWNNDDHRQQQQAVAVQVWRQPHSFTTIHVKHDRKSLAETANPAKVLPTTTTTTITTNTTAIQGLAMSRVLVPFLLRSMAGFVGEESSSEYKGKNIWNEYALAASILLTFFFWDESYYYCHSAKRKVGVLLKSAGLVAVCAVSINRTMAMSLYWQRVVTFIVTWMTFFLGIRKVPALHQVFTHSEWIVVTCGIAVAVSETLAIQLGVNSPSSVATNASSSREMLLAQNVALSGLTGCGMGIVLVYCITRYCAVRPLLKAWSQQALVRRIAEMILLVSLPLVLVELTVSQYFESVDSYFPITTSVPRCLQWMASFLLERELDPHWTTRSLHFSRFWQQLFSFPRFVWLLYWILILAISALVLAFVVGPINDDEPKPSSISSSHCNATVKKKSVVVMRKFFHGLAILLFAPVAMFAPQLLSLSYAIAGALLLIVEYIRSDLPVVQQLYFQYLDPNKDHPQKVVVSHMALLLGCAIPHWIAEAIGGGGRNSNNMARTSSPQANVLLLLRLWGIICLGVGDALGAIIGTWYGRTRWGGPSHRTMEGSLAMGGSMMLACHLLMLCSNNDTGGAAATIWMSVVVLTTLLEVITLQIDNLVLPLAGSAWILFLAKHVPLGVVP